MFTSEPVETPTMLLAASPVLKSSLVHIPDPFHVSKAVPPYGIRNLPPDPLSLLFAKRSTGTGGLTVTVILSVGVPVVLPSATQLTEKEVFDVRFPTPTFPIPTLPEGAPGPDTTQSLAFA